MSISIIKSSLHFSMRAEDIMYQFYWVFKKKLFGIVKSRIKIISALDPAAPWFGNNTIKSEDADYVEVIHTSPLGISQRGGHNDFYPNGGTSQTGCNDDGCNHFRSYLYLAESLATGTNSRLIGQSCRSVQEAMAAGCTSSRRLALGGLQPKRKLGVLYLETNPSPPFAKG